ncbi:branched-chain amino acid ABC transporter permease [Halomarina ordinaria]|uniref:Branched-chain amino acid ABC transporter permease n=1 Tax=Halomarina ordinaria TaxID=3033939 RepID=A0ABD5UBM8_9EURY|nr:branched-chain amino acid ABC transporter permease [Halomarina sp. PSRA2]
MTSDRASFARARDTYSRLNGTPYGATVKLVVGFAFLAALPQLLGVSILGFSLGAFLSVNVLIVTLVYATAGQAWNIMSGYTGYFSFGHAAFFGVGAYVTSKLSVAFGINPWIGLLVGALVAGVIGLAVGFLNFRYDLRGHYFALATFAIALLLQVVVRNMEEFGAAVGIYRPFPGDYGAEFGLVAMQFREPNSYYYLILSFLLVVTVVAWLIKRSQIGYYLFAIRENEDAAASLGISPFRYKMFAIGTSAFFTAWCGAFWSMYVEIIRPSTVFGLTRNVEILLPSVIGGVGSVPGTIIGSFLVFPLSEALRVSFPDIPGLDTVVYGIALVLIALLLPNGVISLGDRLGWGESDEVNRESMSGEERPSDDD